MIAAATGSDLVAKINAHIECKYDSYFLLHSQTNKHVHTHKHSHINPINYFNYYNSEKKKLMPSDDDRSNRGWREKSFGRLQRKQSVKKNSINSTHTIDIISIIVLFLY